MRVDPHNLPPNVIALMNAADKRAFGLCGQASEVNHASVEAFDAAVDAGREVSELHVPFAVWLRRETPCKYIHADTRKKSTLPEGWPDYTVFCPSGRTLLIEFKAKGGRTGQHQLDCIEALVQLGFPVCIARSLKDAQAFVEKHLG